MARTSDHLRNGTPHRGPAVLQVGVALGAAACAVVGIWFRGATGSRTVETFHGPVELVTGGPYAGNPPAVVAEGVGWDVVTLALVVPALLAFAPGVTRGGVRSRVASAGLLFYCLYQYFQYAITYAFGPLTPAFIAQACLSVVALMWAVGTLLGARATNAYPRRAVVAVLVAIPLLLFGMWGQRMAAALPEDARLAALQGVTTMPVQAMDLVWLSAPGLFLAVLVARRVRLADVAAAILVVKGSAMGYAIAVMVINAGLVTGHLEVVPMLLFLVVGLVCTAVGVLAVRALTDEPGPTPA